MTAYYNEFEPKAAAWLRELIRGGHIAPGDVDERSILDVTPDDLRPYTQCHFFAGIGVWSYALRRAGWPDDRPVWTGSCPCQPFSTAGKRGGIADERHLWPAWQWLVGQCRPDVVLGEQVASKDGLAWLDLVRTDLEGTGYAVGFFDLCAAGFGAPHIRQRLYFTGERLGDPEGDRRVGWTDDGDQGRRECPSGQGSAPGGLADDDDARLEGRRQSGRERPAECPAGARGVAGGLADDDDRTGCGEDAGRSVYDTEHHAQSRRGASNWSATGPTNGFWRDADWLFCRDERWRPVEPGTFPLAHGSAARMGFVCARCVQNNAKSQNDEVLRTVQQVLSEDGGCLPKEILQSSVHERSVHKNSTDERSRALSSAESVRSNDVSGLRTDGSLSSPASQRREPEEQRAGEHSDTLCEVPLEGTCEIARCEICGENSDWLADAAFRGNRVARLRGYGNAIVAPQAAAFVEAYLAAERDGFVRLGEDIFG